MPCPHCRVWATQPFTPEPTLRSIPLWPSRWLGDPGMVPRRIEIGTLGDSGKANILRVVTATGAVLYLDDTDGSATHILWHELGGHHDGYRSLIDPDTLATYRTVNTLFVSTES